MRDNLQNCKQQKPSLFREFYLYHPTVCLFNWDTDFIFVPMKHIVKFSFFIAGLILSANIRAQKVLPAFSVKELTKGKIQVSWINPYPDCIQIAVQRSGDSTRNFRTIFSSQSPELPSNGFVDTKTTAKSNWYYRIFYVLKGGNYYFSKIISIKTIPLTPVAVNPVLTTGPVLSHEMIKNKEEQQTKDLHKSTDTVRIYIRNSEVYQLTRPEYIRFKDSIANKTRDTLFVVNNTRADIHSFIPKYVWKPSVYVYTNTQGYVTISLPLAKQHSYTIVFYEDDGSELFRIKNIKEPELILDKVNFFHAGWFSFELFEDNRLKEKHSFQLSKE